MLEPTLGEYLTLSSRVVAPIYPADAEVIVGLLDLHPDAASPAEEGEVIRIFEAGTGHGSLTLHLARAIHAANAHLPSSISDDHDGDGGGDGGQHVNENERKRALIHTLDISPKHSAHAQKTIANYKRGLYTRNIAFHVGTPSSFLTSHSPSPSNSSTPPMKKEWITHALLDLPSSHNELPLLSSYLLPAAKLICFTPSITQILDAQRKVREENLPLYLEKVLELGMGVSGGKEWGVKFVRSRARLRASTAVASSESGTESEGEGEGEGSGDNGDDHVRVVEEEVGAEEDDEWLVSCRPKVGKVVQGGGFVGLWSKIQDRRAFADADTGYARGLGSNVCP